MEKQLRILNGQAVQIQALRNGYQGSVIDSKGSGKKARICRASKGTNSYWKLWHLGGHTVMLESCAYPGHYLDMNHDKEEGDRHVQRITSSSNPGDWAKFKLYGSSLSNVAFQSCRWDNRWLDCHTSGKLLGTIGDYRQSWARFRIAAGASGGNMVASFRWTKLQDIARGDTYKKTISVSVGGGSSRSNSASSSRSSSTSSKVEVSFGGEWLGGSAGAEATESSSRSSGRSSSNTRSSTFASGEQDEITFTGPKTVWRLILTLKDGTQVTTNLCKSTKLDGGKPRFSKAQIADWF